MARESQPVLVFDAARDVVASQQTSSRHGRDGVDAIAEAIETAQAIETHVSSYLAGKPEAVRLATVALLAGGHLLIEDVPGVGKTTLARALADAIDATFGRIQCTSDLMPTDVLGGTILDPKSGELRFRAGPIFHHVVLADEINRTTPKTQSALLEAMAEGQVSIDGTSHALENPFFVIATQNPQDFYGTYPLPESQLDRFLLRMAIGYPDLSTEKRLLQKQGEATESDRPRAAEPVTKDAILRAQEAVATVEVDPAIHDYLLAVTNETRTGTWFSRGASTRAVLAFDRAVRAHAITQGRRYALVDDVKTLAPHVLSHRVRPRQQSEPIARQDAEALIRTVLDQVPVPL